ncbi:MAG: hypothetical protein ACXVY5_09625, partial [Gaiellales bacterium]
MSVLPASAVIEEGRLLLGGVSASELAAEYGTPLLVYDEDTLRRRARAYVEGLAGYPGGGRAGGGRAG